MERFKTVIPFNSYPELHTLIDQQNIDIVYRLSWGHDESHILAGKNRPWVIHAVFMHSKPYADKYAYISEWLRDTCNKDCDFVPHIVDLPNIDADMRAELGISPDKFVVGGLGGTTSFDVPFATKAVVRAIEARPDLQFVFMNINKFCEHERCLFLPGTYNLEFKTKFINSCDAMVHARLRGETFGLSLGEFSARNKRVLTWAGSAERAHIQILGDKGILYYTEDDLVSKLVNLTKDDLDYDRYSQFSPEVVMPKFSKVFLEN